jgi:hypothetical protein
MRRPFPIRRTVTYCGLSVFYLCLLLPIVWLVLSSFRNSDSVQSGRLFPSWSELTFQNYVQTFQISNFVTYIVNSCVIAFSVMVLTVFLGSLGAYSLSRHSRPGGRRLLRVCGFVGRLFVRFYFVAEQRDPDSADRFANLYDQSAGPMGIDHRRDSPCHRSNGDFLFDRAAPIGFWSHRRRC